MLPQGRFQAFLRARSEERHRLLQQLFRTARFEDVERWLRDRRRALRRESLDHHDRVADLVSRVSEAADAPLPDGGTSTTSAAPARTGEVDAVVGRPATGAEESARRGRRPRAGPQSPTRQPAREALDRVAAAPGAQQRMPTPSPSATASPRRRRTTPDQVDTARRGPAGRRGRPPGAGSRPAGAGRRACPGAQRRPHPGCGSAGWRLETADLDDAVLAALSRPSGRRRRRRPGAPPPRGRPRRPAARGRPTPRRANAQLAAERDELDRPAVATFPTSSRLLRQRESAARDAERDLPAATEVGSLRSRQAAGRSGRHARRGADRGHRPAPAGVDEAQQLREVWLHLQEQRIRGMAAELAGALAVGDDCPVCGSADHPRPASPDARRARRRRREGRPQAGRRRRGRLATPTTCGCASSSPGSRPPGPPPTASSLRIRAELVDRGVRAAATHGAGRVRGGPPAPRCTPPRPGRPSSPHAASRSLETWRSRPRPWSASARSPSTDRAPSWPTSSPAPAATTLTDLAAEHDEVADGLRGGLLRP